MVSAALISLAPGFSQVMTGGVLIAEPFQRLTNETVKTVHVQSWGASSPH
jgi:hypothetical protein